MSTYRLTKEVKFSISEVVDEATGRFVINKTTEFLNFTEEERKR